MGKKADLILSEEGREYHLQIRPGDISPLCLFVGDPDRATLIAEKFFKKAKLVGNHRGLKTYTGYFQKKRMSVITTGMGSPSTGIVLPEAYRCGARVFIRVGSCGSLIEHSMPGDVIIVTAAVRLEGATRNWAPIDTAFASHNVVAALCKAGKALAPKDFKVHAGVEATTDCFNEGQARPNVDGIVPCVAQDRHKEMLRLNVACYSMEAAAFFIWCATHGEGLSVGVINAVFANRVTNDFSASVDGQSRAAHIALLALYKLDNEG